MQKTPQTASRTLPSKFTLAAHWNPDIVEQLLIDGSTHVVKELRPYKRGKVYQLSESAVLKIGSDVTTVEVETMQLLAREGAGASGPARPLG